MHENVGVSVIIIVCVCVTITRKAIISTELSKISCPLAGRNYLSLQVPSILLPTIPLLVGQNSPAHGEGGFGSVSEGVGCHAGVQ